MDALLSLKEGVSLIESSLVLLQEITDNKTKDLNANVDKLEEVKVELELVNIDIQKNRQALKDLQLTSKISSDALKIELDKVIEQTETATDELEAVKKKHTQFVSYQIKAEKALRAREQSIIEREKTLEEIIGQAKRRTSIIGI